VRRLASAFQNGQFFLGRLRGFADTNDPRYQILALLPNRISIRPKERNTMFFPVFSEGRIQPMVKWITQVEVQKRVQTQERPVFWVIWVICLNGGMAAYARYPKCYPSLNHAPDGVIQEA
jgi:hypothetical protein